MTPTALHTWTISRRSKLLRLYLWAYQDKRDVNFCKLFWGIVLLPIWGVENGFFFTLAYVPIKIKDRYDERPHKSVQSLGESFTEGASSVADRVSAFFQRHSWIGPVVFWSPSVAAVTAVLGLAGWGVYEMVAHAAGTLVVLLYIGLAVVAAIVGAGVLVALGYLLGRLGVFRAIDRGVVAVAYRVGGGAKGIGRFLVTGHHAVKYRTCPTVKVVD